MARAPETIAEGFLLYRGKGSFRGASVVRDIGRAYVYVLHVHGMWIRCTRNWAAYGYSKACG